MSTKELAYQMIEGLTEEQLNALIVILRGWEIENEQPNDTTLASMQECEEIINGKIPAKRYNTARELIDDIMSEESNEE